MTTLIMANWIVLLGLVLGGGLAWLQWWLLKRLVRRPTDWAAASVIGAGVSMPLTTGVALDSLARAGLPPVAVATVGVWLLLAQAVLGAGWVALVAWWAGKK